MPPCLLVQTTATQPGAIAILQLIGDSAAIMRTLTGIGDWPIGRARLVSFEDIDEGLAGRPAPDVTQLMPHGGPRVVDRLTRRLIELGAQPSDADVDPDRVYPEAADRFEALALAAVARAHSPLAIELLFDQPRRWRAEPALSDSDLARSRRLNRLVDPPIVVVAGPANVGKSTLSNALLGRSMSIALNLPGTTRDYTIGRIEFAGLVADWYDTPGIPATPATPGLRQADDRDSIEAKALDLAQRLIERADLLISMTDHDHAWPALPRDPDIHVINKIDLRATEERTPLIPSPASLPRSQGRARVGVLGARGRVREGVSCSPLPLGKGLGEGVTPLPISALHGTGLSALVTAVRQHLVPETDLTHPGPWLFDDRLADR